MLGYWKKALEGLETVPPVRARVVPFQSGGAYQVQHRERPRAEH
jgi:hypothetical protein